ncbi:UbiA family prenyltransferase [Rickettsia endosymbiont of Cardiosporidium cionae]|uniref:UbiA family prenyltransferase n=1 Tax=Rickettsia endosymbiont of Cardiosporidium cionae TaxID=2777155 RepID=UPI0018931737|nr:UbiA family prenyltransferase [Rickettsia endosymbiont of Cardiosporidium cionae]KAF8818510.1 4-hydroxybenzoate octaprenyltransferase [Rickettsia endosymbiont of Cardiosporidium cionae]
MSKSNTSVISHIIELTRLNNPTGYMLVFFPTLFGLLAGYASINHSGMDIGYKFLMFFIASIAIRTAGSIINDIFDRDIDGSVYRTKNRPLANNNLTVKSAIIIIIPFLSVALIILSTLNRTSIVIGCIGFILILIYPLLKRVTYFPQIFLGLTFNIGTLIGYTSVTNTIEINAIMLYISCFLWTTGFDTIYAFADLNCDKKISIKSMAIFLENKPYKLIITILYLSFIGIMFLVYESFNANKIRSLNQQIFTIILFILSSFILLWQTYTLDIKDRKSCLIRFKSNNYIGTLLGISWILTL